AGGGGVALSKREDPEELLRSADLLATGGDPPQMRRGLTRHLLGDIQLGKYDDVDIAKWAQRMRMLECDDREIGLTEPAKELGAHVVRAPRARLCVHDVLERSRGPIFVAPLDRFRREPEAAILPAPRLGI